VELVFVPLPRNIDIDEILDDANLYTRHTLLVACFAKGCLSDIVLYFVKLLPSLIEYTFEPGPGLNAAYAIFNKLVENTNSELLFTMTVGEYLFGFEDPLLTAIIDALFPDAQTHTFGLFLLVSWNRNSIKLTSKHQGHLVGILQRCLYVVQTFKRGCCG